MALARLIRIIAGIVFGVIALGIVLVLLSANPHNQIVSDIHDAAKWLVGPFGNLFAVHGPKLGTLLNWGLAAIVYLGIGHALATAIARAALRGGGMRGGGMRRRRAVV